MIVKELDAAYGRRSAQKAAVCPFHAPELRDRLLVARSRWLRMRLQSTERVDGS